MSTDNTIRAKDSAWFMCTVCGLERGFLLEMVATYGTFNKNADGTVKTRDEIQAELNQKVADEVARLAREGMMCQKCREEIEA